MTSNPFTDICLVCCVPLDADPQHDLFVLRIENRVQLLY
jgi:hypothetical protein